jgi:predicted nucleotidyltransferase
MRLPKGIALSILQTLKYSDHFGSPLTSQEIHLRLITSHKVTYAKVIQTLTQMVKKKEVSRLQNYYFLPGQNQLATDRNSRFVVSQDQFHLAQKLAKSLAKIPYVLAIYLTGSLAMNNSKSDSDIDFMIITKERRLWTTRFLLTIVTTLFGLRRYPSSKNTAGKLCLNLYLTPLSFQLPIHKQSLYTAYELIQAVPLYDPLNTHASLLTENLWISSHLANFKVPPTPRIKGHNCSTTRPGIIGQIFEFLAYHLQLLYMHHKLTREYITKDSAFFHPHNPADIVLAKLR